MSKYSHISFKPPAGAVAAAKRGLAMRRKHGRGGTAIGIARARDIAGGKNMSPGTVRRIKAFFDRHASDKEGKGWSPGEPGYPSNGRIANLLWGGPACYAWSRKVVKQMNAADERSDAVETELRLLAEQPRIEVREEDNGKTVIRGYAALYNSDSQEMPGGFIERIAPGAFDEALSSNPDVFAKLDHERVLGRTSSGTLELKADERGLSYVIHPKRSDADVVEALERGDLTGSSFAFRLDGTNGDRWYKDDDGRTIRELRSLRIFDVGPVYSPAYPETSSYVSMRAMEKAQEEAAASEVVEEDTEVVEEQQAESGAPVDEVRELALKAAADLRVTSALSRLAS